MKANKALKRLAKIETLLSDVMVRYSPGAPHMHEVLQDAKAAVARAKEAVSLQASSGTAKHSKPPAKTAPEQPKPKHRISEEARAATAYPAPAKKADPKRHAAKNAPVKAAAAKATKEAAP